VRRVALEVPLRLLAVRRGPERDDARAARIERLDDPLDGSALARGVAALEDQQEPLARILDPVLKLDELEL
jgi:hypothetical protein